MRLELGIIPVSFVLMDKQINFFKCILDESMSSVLRQVYENLKEDSVKGNFFYLVKIILKNFI